MKRVRIGLLGCGTVGGGLVRLVGHEQDRLRLRFGVELEIRAILVRDPAKDRPGVDRRLITTNALDVIDGDCDIVVEAVGGVHTAGTFVRRAIQRGRHVVTANKALLAANGAEIFAAAGRRGVAIGFEASVCGGVPVVGALRRGLAGDTIESIRGILNGTSNYVLTRMDEGMAFADALALAQSRGFAEADPALDVSGEDAMQKLQILATLAFSEPVRKVTCEGLVDDDRRTKRPAHQVVRQVAEARRVAGGVELCVAPRVLNLGDPLAHVRDETNAVIVRGRAVGDVTLTGRGAGSAPTAAALLADIVEISTQARRASRSPSRSAIVHRVSSSGTGVRFG